MDVEDARLYLEYNGWANQLLLRAAGELTPAEFVQQLGASFGSVKGTLVHMLYGERTWLLWWQGKPSLPELRPDDFADAAALAVAFSALENEQTVYFASLTDEALRSSCQVKDRRYVLAHLVYHMMSHSMYHRGQIAHLLRQLGHAPPNTGFRTGFLDERRLFETI